MLEMIVFAVTFVVAQIVATFAIMRLVMSEWFMKKYYKWMMDLFTKLSVMGFESEDEESE